jgi:hypothetical protein
MLIRTTLRLGLMAAGFTAAAGLFTLPALAGEIYSWRTEDGAYAFTDDPKAVPARYRNQAETRTNTGIANYARLTAPEPGSGDAYAKRLAQRLDHLRDLNRNLDSPGQTHAVPSVPSLSIKSGDLNNGVPVDGNEGPVVIETVRFRYRGEMATRHNTVVRKGDSTVAVIKGQRNAGEINQAPEVTHEVD